MEELIQAEMEEIEDYINIKYTILASKDLLEKRNNKSHEINQMRDKVQSYIKRYTTFQDENFTLSEENHERIFEELENSMKINKD